MTQSLLIITAIITQIAVFPNYLRPDAEIEERIVTAQYVHDGDTFKGTDGISYRLAGINAPEVAHPAYGKPDGEPGGEEASDALRNLIEGRTVVAQIDRANSTDRYGRTVAIVISGDIDVNLEMIRSGHAEPRYIDLSPMIDEEIFIRESKAPVAAAVLSEAGSTSPAGAHDLIPETAPAAPSPFSAPRVLAPGDRIRVVIGPQSEDFTINPDGEILIKGLGVFRAGGLSSKEASADLDTAVRARGITAEPITVFYLAPPSRPAPKTVIILGAIRKPGTYPAKSLLEVISQAEGFSFEANPTEVRVTTSETTTTISAVEILSGAAPDITLRGGEIIVVPPLPRILVSGAVAKPNWVTALTLTEAISAAGGPLPEADLTRTELRSRIDTPIRIDAQRIFSGKTDDIRLDDRSRVTIPTRPKAIVPLVQVYGPVQRPGTTEAFTLADAIRESKPDTTADIENVILDRGSNGATALNAKEISLGHALDTDLNQGDRVLIPKREQPAPDTPQTVTVLGAVARPGQYPQGTLTTVLANAGGPANSARTSTIRVRLPDGNDGNAGTYDLKKITTGKQPDPNLPANSTVFVEDDETRRQGMNDLRTLIGVISTIALLALRLGG